MIPRRLPVMRNLPARFYGKQDAVVRSAKRSHRVNATTSFLAEMYARGEAGEQL